MRSRGPGTGPAARGAQALSVAALLSLHTSSSAAQTIQPVVVEYRQNKVAARFELVNDGLRPLDVVLEPQSFDVSDAGEAIYRPLDPRIRLRLSAMSLRIPPRETRVVFYEASADSLPAWFVIPCTFSGLPRRSGLEVRVELPHTVYLVQRDRLRPEDVAIPNAAYDAVTKVVQVDIENRGPRLGRALEAEVTGHRHREQHASFPLLPHGRRRLLVPWNAALVPTRVIVRFDGFAVERPLPENVSAQD